MQWLVDFLHRICCHSTEHCHAYDLSIQIVSLPAVCAGITSVLPPIIHSLCNQNLTIRSYWLKCVPDVVSVGMFCVLEVEKFLLVPLQNIQMKTTQ